MKNQKTIFLIGCFFLLGLGFFLVRPWFGFKPVWVPESIASTLIARAHFLTQGGFLSGWWPDWYLGTPYRLIGSPLLPLLLMGLNRLGISLWTGYRLVAGLGVVFLPGVVGWLAYQLSKGVVRPDSSPDTRAESGIVAGLVVLIAPSLLFGFPALWTLGGRFGVWSWPMVMIGWLGNGGRLVGLNFVLASLGFSFSWLKGKKSSFWPALILAGLGLLVELGVLVTWLVGLILLVISFWMVGEKPEKIWRRGLKLAGSVLGLIGFMYTPRFWWHQLSAPSLAGKRALSVALFTGRFLSVLIPLVLGLLVVKKGKKKQEAGWVLARLWLITFGLLTLGRFLADTDFWQDYSTWGAELGVGVGLVVGLGIGRVKRIRWPQIGIVVVILLSGLGWLIHWPSLVEIEDEEYRDFIVSTRAVLEDRLGWEERLFVSGSLVFWLNEDLNLSQVRGGLDQGAVHPVWHHAAYQIREGESGELAYRWLRALGSGWVLVHGSESRDPYLDFKYPEKFEDGGWFGLVWEKDGDRLYQVKKTGIARVVTDWEKMIKLTSPAAGNDADFLAKYDSLIGISLPLVRQTENRFQVDVLGEVQGVSVAVSFDPGWRANMNGRPLKIYKDPIGQLLVRPDERGKVTFDYAYPMPDRLLGLGLTLLTGLWLMGLVKKRQD